MYLKGFGIVGAARYGVVSAAEEYMHQLTNSTSSSSLCVGTMILGYVVTRREQCNLRRDPFKKLYGVSYQHGIPCLRRTLLPQDHHTHFQSTHLVSKGFGINAGVVKYRRSLSRMLTAGWEKDLRWLWL